MKNARRGAGDGPQGPTPPRRGPPLGHAYRGYGPPGPPLAPPSRLYILLKTLIHGERPQKAASAGRKTPREKELSGKQISAREIPSRRGEIIAINTIIKLDFILIIIIIYTIISTITIITTPSRYKNHVDYLHSSWGKLSRC